MFRSMRLIATEPKTALEFLKSAVGIGVSLKLFTIIMNFLCFSH